MMSKILTILIIVLSTQFSLNLSAECIKGNCANQQSTYNYTDGSKYIGEYKDGTRHGQGTYNHASGDQYIGEWKYSKMHGQGTYTFANGNQYIGEYKDDKYHGQGTYNYADGNQYIGKFKDDKRHGLGTFTWTDGTSDKGIWRNDEYIGTVFEVEEKRKADAIKAEQEREERIKYNKIYNACYLDKGADVDMTSATMRGVVDEVCSDIANNPSFYERWKYE